MGQIMYKKHLRTGMSYVKTKGIRFFYVGLLKRQVLHFLHIGKTGGTAVSYAIRGGVADSQAIRQYKVCRRYLIELHPHSFRLVDVPVDEKLFFFIRDPISRFVSGFNSRQRQGQPKFFVPWTKNEKIAFEEFKTPNELAIALSSKDAEKKSKAIMAMKNIIHVRDSYWKWFENEDYFKSRLSDITFIGSQESLAEDFETFKSQLGMLESVKLPDDDVLAHKSPKNVDNTLEDESIANLKQWYKDDFQFVALCKRIIEAEGY